MSLIRISKDSDRFATFKAALSAAGLPAADLEADEALYFALESCEGEPTVFVGLIPFGQDGLLRSLLVPRILRGQGYGRQGIDQIARQARQIGIRHLWLLTTSAEGYFVRLGFRLVRREEAPTAIADSRQFSTTCPDTAVLMCLTLA
jgi:arsenate reductase